MARITDLPEEVLVMILRKLDFPTLCRVYDSSQIFRNVIKLSGVIVECNMSLNLMSSAHTTFKECFKSVSKNLLVLNMRGVHDISKAKVLPAFKQLKRLKVLDISFTNIDMSDFTAIYDVCPTLKDVTVDFKFSQTVIPENTLQKCQSVFEHFENVHFVGALSNLLTSKVILHILKKSKLDTFKISAVETDNVHTTVVSSDNTAVQMPHFNHFAAFLLINWRSGRAYENISDFPVISLIELKNYEFCIIYTLSRHRHIASVYASPFLANFFKDHFNLNTRSVSEYMTDPKGNVALMVWNRETTRFDNIFFEKLYSRVKTYFPFYYEANSCAKCPYNYDWIYTNPKPSGALNNDAEGLQEKKRKTSMPNFMLDYDNLLKDKSKAELSLIFLPNVIMYACLPLHGQYFDKITYLSLCGAVRYSSNFFVNLLARCNNLATLSVEFMSITASRYAYDILHGIEASKCLKNLRLIDKGMVFKQYFDLLCKCTTLENIHLLDSRQWDHCEVADPNLLLESCPNLYSVFIEAPFAESAVHKQLELFRKAKKCFVRPHLRVVINQCSNTGCLYRYDPFVEVFKLNAIKPI